MEELLFEISETAHAIRRAFDQRATDLGVTRAQWRVLARLKREPGLRQVDLAERLDIEPITLCRIIDRLQEADLVERQRDPSDRRAWRIELTTTADPLVERLRALARDFADDAFGGVTDAEMERLRKDLRTVRSNLATAQHKNRTSA